MGDDGGCGHRHHPSHHQGPPQQVTSINTSQGEESRSSTLQRRFPTGPELIHQLPERARRAEETAFITDIFDHAAQAHEHLSSVYANISTLAKITEKTTLLTIINGAIRPLVQINIPEGFLNPVEDRHPKTNRRRKMGEGSEDGAACVKLTVLGPQTEEWPHPYTCSCSLVEAEPQVFQ